MSNQIECPHCGEPITDDKLRAMWGRRNGLKTSDAKRAGALKASKVAAEKRRDKNEKE